MADRWQWDVARLYSDRLEYSSGLSLTCNSPQSVWIGMPRGHDKTSSIARALYWALAFGKRPIYAIAAAADKDQASLIVQAMRRIQELNVWTQGLVKVDRHQADGPGGHLEVLSADAHSAWGRTADLIIADELTHWPRQDLWDAIWSGREKVPGSLYLVISNAGVLDSWQWEFRKKALKDPTWRVWDLDTGWPRATWLEPGAWDRLRLFLPAHEAARVLDNRWVDPGEIAGWITLAEAEACVGEVGCERLDGVQYYAGIDYGPVRDRTALCVLHVDPDTDCVVVDTLLVLQGSRQDRVKIETVEAWIEDVAIGQYNADLVFDTYQMEGTVQKYEHRHKVSRFEVRGTKRNYELAECLRGLIINKRVRWSRSAGVLRLDDGSDESFAQELSRLVIKPVSYGYRIDHESGKHDDRAVSVGMAALEAIKDLKRGPWVEHDINEIKVPSVTHDLSMEALLRPAGRMIHGVMGWRG